PPARLPRRRHHDDRDDARARPRARGARHVQERLPGAALPRSPAQGLRRLARLPAHQRRRPDDEPRAESLPRRRARRPPHARGAVADDRGADGRAGARSTLRRMPGKLLVVGTPLGNLGDFPPRAVEALQSASLILCEDTRHTRKLLTHFGIDRPTDRLDEHTEDARSEQFIDRIEAGETIAVVSDAGMPVVSDPGYRIVRLARERGVTVEPIPGPFAGVLALAASGIAPLPFTFLGFTPHRHGERLDFYRELAALGHTAIVYESSERVVDSLRDARDVVGGGVE